MTNKQKIYILRDLMDIRAYLGYGRVGFCTGYCKAMNIPFSLTIEEVLFNGLESLGIKKPKKPLNKIRIRKIDALIKKLQTEMTQSKQILSALKRGPVTNMKAFAMFNITALQERIRDLRNEGHRIETEMVTKNKKRYAKYTLK